jgi:hypothetical protein
MSLDTPNTIIIGLNEVADRTEAQTQFPVQAARITRDVNNEEIAYKKADSSWTYFPSENRLTGVGGSFIGVSAAGVTATNLNNALAELAGNSNPIAGNGIDITGNTIAVKKDQGLQFNQTTGALKLGPHYLSMAASGVYSGGGLSASGPADGNVNIAACEGFTIDSNTFGVDSIVTIPVSTSGIVHPISAPNLLNNVTYIGLTSAGTVEEWPTFPTPQQRRENIFLGAVVHTDHATVTIVNDLPDVSSDITGQLHDLSRRLGFFNIEDNGVTANGANLSINKAAGTAFKTGANWANNKKDPDTLTLEAKTLSQIRYRTQTGVEEAYATVLTPNYYDVAGTKTEITPTSNKATIQRIYVFPSNEVRIQYGQTVYPSFADAVDAVGKEAFVTDTNIKENGLLLAQVVMRADATDLSDSTQAQFFQAGRFGEIGSVGSSLVGTLQNAYNNSIDPEIITDSTRGALSLRRGSGADTDNVLEVQNGAGTTNFSVNGEGNVQVLGGIEVKNSTGTSRGTFTGSPDADFPATQFDGSMWFSNNTGNPTLQFGANQEAYISQNPGAQDLIIGNTNTNSGAGDKSASLWLSAQDGTAQGGEWSLSGNNDEYDVSNYPIYTKIRANHSTSGGIPIAGITINAHSGNGAGGTNQDASISLNSGNQGAGNQSTITFDADDYFFENVAPSTTIAPTLGGHLTNKTYVDGLFVSAPQYKGFWNASTNSPALADGVGTQGDYYIVNVAGSTTIDGESNWLVGDWIMFNGSMWGKIDNTNSTVSAGTNISVNQVGEDYEVSVVDSPVFSGQVTVDGDVFGARGLNEILGFAHGTTISDGANVLLRDAGGTDYGQLRVDGTASLSWYNNQVISHLDLNVLQVVNLASYTNSSPTQGDIWNNGTEVEVEGDVQVNGDIESSGAGDHIVKVASTDADSMVTIENTGVLAWTMGADRSDSSDLKLGQHTTLGSNLAMTVHAGTRNVTFANDVQVNGAVTSTAGNGTATYIVENDASLNVIELMSDASGDGHLRIRSSTGVTRFEVDGGAGISGGFMAQVNGAFSVLGDVQVNGKATIDGGVAVRSNTQASTATLTIASDDVDFETITAQAAALSIANPTGTPDEGQELTIRIKDNATARAITWSGTQWRAMGVTLPTTTVISKLLYIKAIYNSTDTKWDVVAVNQEA